MKLQDDSKIRNNRDKYIIMLPNKSDLKVFSISSSEGSILFKTNCPNLVKYFYPIYSFELLDEKSLDDNTTLCVTVIVEKNLLENSQFDPEAPDGYILKTDKRYNIENQNHYFKINNNKFIQINYYPTHYVITYDEKNMLYDGICCHVETATYIAKIMVKRMFCHIYKEKGFYPLHAAGVSYYNDAFLFLGSSHSGKSTIFANLVMDGFLPINDDLVFLKRDEFGIITNSISNAATIRKNGIQKVPKIKKDDMLVLGSYCYLNSRKYIFDRDKSSVNLRAIYITEIANSDCLKINPIKFDDVKRDIIKGFIAHYNEEVDDSLLKFVIGMKNIPIFCLKLPKEMKGFAKDFKKMLYDSLNISFE